MSILALDVKTVKLITTTQVITSVYTAVKELIENALDANADNIEINLVCNKFICNMFAHTFIIYLLKNRSLMNIFFSFRQIMVHR